MDIQVASNFERYLFYRTGENGARVSELMQTVKNGDAISVPPLPSGHVDDTIRAESANTDETLTTIKRYHESHGYLLDPHTAVGVSVGERLRDPSEPLLCLATAHPAKFSDAIKRATDSDLAHHELIDGLKELPVRAHGLPANTADVKSFITESIH